MANALGLVSIRKGYDPRDFALMAFGGGGPLHAGALIEDLGIRKVLVPRTYAPVPCALGDTLSDIRESNSKAFFARASDLDLAGLETSFGELIGQSEADMGEAATALEGRVDRAVSMRYVGQTHEVIVPLEADLEQDAESRWTDVLNSFHRLHKSQFSFSREEIETEVIGAQVDRWAFRSKPALGQAATSQIGDAPEPRDGRREALFSLERGFELVDVFDGLQLEPGFRAEGPAIVQEAHTAIVVYPGQTVELAPGGVFVIEAGGDHDGGG
jgi:N-methylhydantoinase A